MPNRNTRAERAKLFQPFDSLRGFNLYLREKERIVVEKKILSEDDLEQLDYLIHAIQVGMLVKIVYYDEDEYIMKEGILAAIDLNNRKEIQVVEQKIPINKIVSIEL